MRHECDPSDFFFSFERAFGLLLRRFRHDYQCTVLGSQNQRAFGDNEQARHFWLKPIPRVGTVCRICRTGYSMSDVWYVEAEESGLEELRGTRSQYTQ